MNRGKLAVTSAYKPPGSAIAYKEPETFSYEHVNVIIGDFNSHSTSWGYQASNEDGNLLEEWAEVHHLDLIHDAKLPPSFNSCRWRRGYNPYLAFSSDRIKCQCKKQVLEPIPHSQHRPIANAISDVVVPQKGPLRRRFNFQKANWEKFARSLDVALLDLEPVPSIMKKKNMYITPVLHSLHWLPVHKRITFKILLLVYPTLHQLAPSYLQDTLNVYKPSRNLRSSTSQTLQLPRIRHTWGECTFTTPHIILKWI